ncbi:hypothetical protein KC343_g7150 [Hortaea werneckii]|nr:hypothetical protein KC352_g15555 [Hortaea werneckii]KAI7564007.1 hypothetical protein KC317_g7342 [Hortaea werneckii]KAI7615835.1 hypothetical protein KC346_g6277 [Hortaea werneckii]KAI7623931.1 hypothetical protein KC343_g7150 [Hortaea werneckii]KAI7665307.1 hypothetical protein KC319_g7247 [Hortaea werneckii]
MARKRKKAADAITTPDKAFPFEKLPPELRNMVYEYYLVTPRQVLITRRRQRQNGSIGAKGPFKLYSLAVVDGTVLRHATAKNKSLLGLTGSSLLRVSKSIHEETESMLYGANRFLFTRNVAAMQFLHELGPRTQLLRHVSIEFYTNNNINCIIPALDELRSANDKLDLLEIAVDLSLLREQRDVPKFKIRRLIESYAGAGNSSETQARFSAIRFSVHTHRFYLAPEDCSVREYGAKLAEAKEVAGRELLES